MGHPCGYCFRDFFLAFLWRKIYHWQKIRGSQLSERTALPSLLFLLSKGLFYDLAGVSKKYPYWTVNKNKAIGYYYSPTGQLYL